LIASNYTEQISRTMPAGYRLAAQVMEA